MGGTQSISLDTVSELRLFILYSKWSLNPSGQEKHEEKDDLVFFRAQDQQINCLKNIDNCSQSESVFNVRAPAHLGMASEKGHKGGTTKIRMSGESYGRPVGPSHGQVFGSIRKARRCPDFCKYFHCG